MNKKVIAFFSVLCLYGLTLNAMQPSSTGSSDGRGWDDGAELVAQMSGLSIAQVYQQIIQDQLQCLLREVQGKEQGFVIGIIAEWADSTVEGLNTVGLFRLAAFALAQKEFILEQLAAIADTTTVGGYAVVEGLCGSIAYELTAAIEQDAEAQLMLMQTFV